MILSFKSRFSGAASITKSAFLTASAMSIEVVTLVIISAEGIFPLPAAFFYWLTKPPFEPAKHQLWIPVHPAVVQWPLPRLLIFLFYPRSAEPVLIVHLPA